MHQEVTLSLFFPLPVQFFPFPNHKFCYTYRLSTPHFPSIVSYTFVSFFWFWTLFLYDHSLGVLNFSFPATPYPLSLRPPFFSLPSVWVLPLHFLYLSLFPKFLLTFPRYSHQWLFPSPSSDSPLFPRRCNFYLPPHFPMPRRSLLPMVLLHYHSHTLTAPLCVPTTKCTLWDCFGWVHTCIHLIWGSVFLVLWKGVSP